jgi:4-hydroxybenzoate polyprenyltransferase
MASKPQRQPEIADKTVGWSDSARSGILSRWRRIWKILEYSSAYLALIAIAKIYIVVFVLSLQMSLAPIVAGLVTFAIYAVDRLTHVETDRESTPGRAAFVRQHDDSLYALAAVAYGIGVALSVLGGPVAFAFALLPGGVWIVYACDWIPAIERDVHRLKDILVVNSALIAAAWAVPIVVVPIAFADATIGPAAVVLVVYFFLGTFTNVEVANVRDTENDRQEGVATLPTVFGIARTRQFLYGLAALTIAVLGYAAFGGYLSAPAATILATGPVSLLGVIALLGRVESDKMLTLGAECTRLPVFLAFAISVVVW